MERLRAYTPERQISEIPDLASKSLLDIGAGRHCKYGLAYLASIRGNSEKNITALDLKYKRKSYITFSERAVRADANNLPFNSNSFDIAATGYLFDLLKDNCLLKLIGRGTELRNVISESARVLKDKGYLVGDVPLSGFLGDFIQIIRYKKAMNSAGFKLINDGLGYNSQNTQKTKTYFFLAQKI